jgi:hypothetical protein
MYVKSFDKCAYLLVALFLPFGDEIGVSIAILEQPVVERFTDGLFLVVEIVDIPRP